MYIFLACMYVYHVCLVQMEGLLELELWIAVSHMWELGRELRSSARATRAPNSRAISPAL